MTSFNRTTPPELSPGNEREICIFIKKMRVELEISQTDLGLLLGLSTSSINLFEAERHIGSKYHKVPDSTRWEMITCFARMPIPEVKDELRRKKEERDSENTSSKLAADTINHRKVPYQKPPPLHDTIQERMEKIPARVLLQTISDRYGLPLEVNVSGVLIQVTPRRRLPNWSVGDLIREIKMHGFNCVALSHDKDKENVERAAAQREVDALFRGKKEEDAEEKNRLSLRAHRSKILAGIKKLDRMHHGRKRKNRQ